MRDGYNRHVPGRLREIFAGRQSLAEWCRDLQVLRHRLMRMEGEPFARDLRIRRIAGMLESVQTLVVLGAPLTQCDCDLQEHDCPKCKGSRWVTKSAQLLAGEVSCKLGST